MKTIFELCSDVVLSRDLYHNCKLFVKPDSCKGKGLMGAYSLPESMVILTVNLYSKDIACLYFFNIEKNIEQNVYINVNDKFHELKDRELFEAIDIYDLYNKSHLFRKLHHSFYIGSDPEIFAQDENGNLIPAFDFLGSKAAPDKVKDMMMSNSNKPNNLYWDGFQAEFDTTPGSCLGWHSDSIYNGLMGIMQRLTAKHPKAVLSSKTTFDIDPEVIAKTEDKYVDFGCMPSLNVYGMNGLKALGREVFFRSAGGHIHFGLNDKTKKDIPTLERMVKSMDAIIGVACVSLFATMDDPRRRTMYGLAGEYRLPPHGLEYRTLSNAWLCHPAIMNLVIDIARKAAVMGQYDLMDHWNASQDETIDTIQTCDVKQARVILKRNENTFKQIITAAYHPYIHTFRDNSHHVNKGFSVFMEGVESVIVNPQDVVGNWLLDAKNKGSWINHCNSPGKNWSSAISQLYTIPKPVKKIA